MALILDGKKVANELYDKLPNMKGKELAIITIGDNDASSVYVRNKIKACKKVGLKGVNYHYSQDTFCFAIDNKIQELSTNPDVVGIMVQKPYPDKFNNIENLIDPHKDVDGLTIFNMAETLSGKQPYYYPATPKGIITLLDYYNIPIKGKNVVIVGRSNIVGKPLAAMMMARNATVTICHSKTDNNSLRYYLNNADIIVSATGNAKWLNSSYNLSIQKPVIIDVGINRDENGKLCGDVDYESVFPYVSAITPVPGGVGPMTVYSLISNCCHE